jgi:predicted Zn finger-like uncharacterized protein/prepilin-type processing-associated H-X9-DG protein
MLVTMSAMSQTIQCPHCGQTYALTPEQVPQYAGQTINCTRCTKAFTVPQLIAPAIPIPPGSEGFSAAQPAMQQTMSPYPGGVSAGMSQPMPYGGYAAYGEQRPGNGLAIAALILGIIGIFIPIFIFGAVAVILGALAMSKRPTGKGLAIAGLSIGAVSLLLNGACITYIFVPSFSRAREGAHRVQCASNMRQIGQALLLYANENNGAFPDDLAPLLITQDITSEVFVCPSSTDTPSSPGSTPQQQAANLHAGGHLSYIYVGKGLTNSTRADTVLLLEPLSNHNNGGINILWCDGHVSFHMKAEAQKIIADVQAGKNPPP